MMIAVNGVINVTNSFEAFFIWELKLYRRVIYSYFP